MTALPQTDIDRLAKTGWRYADKQLSKEFSFASFPDAFGFMSMTAMGIDKLDHHPTWTNTYDKVMVGLSTHDSGDVTAKDVELADFMDHIASRFPLKH